MVTGIEIRWINVSARPMAIGVKPGGARLSVAPMMIRMNMVLITTSQTNP